MMGETSVKLFYAISSHNHDEMRSALAAYKGDLNKDRLSFLSEALRSRNAVAFRELVNRGAELSKDFYRNYRDAVFIVDNKLVDAYDKMPSSKSIEWFDGFWATKTSSLHSAASDGNLEVIDFLMQHTSAKNYLNSKSLLDEKTPLFRAAEAGSSRCVQALIDLGAEIDTCAWLGETPLFAALKKGHACCVKLLLQNSAKFLEGTVIGYKEIKLIVDNSLEEEFLKAPGSEFVKWVHDGSCKIEEISTLQRAAHFGDFAVMWFLLYYTTAKEDINKMVGFKSKTPLRTVAKRGHDRCLKLLLEHNANPNRCDEYEYMPPLMLAAGKGHVQCVKYLLEYNADPNECRFDTKETALDMMMNALIARPPTKHGDEVDPKARLRKNVEIIRMLIEHEGGTDSEARLTKNAEVERLLTEHAAGADPEARLTKNAEVERLLNVC